MLSCTRCRRAGACRRSSAVPVRADNQRRGALEPIQRNDYQHHCPRGIDLTQAGELFLERARVAVSAADVAPATERDLEAGVIGSLRLGPAAGARSPRASELMLRFGRESPVRLSSSRTRDRALGRVRSDDAAMPTTAIFTNEPPERRRKRAWDLRRQV